MGAGGWHYTTTYDPDPELALRRLRNETFESGDYLPLGGLFRIPRDRDLPPDTPIKFRLSLYVFRMIAAISVAIHIHRFTRGDITPRSVDELLYIAGENGTQSILHITHTSDIIELGVAAPLSKYRLLSSIKSSRAGMDVLATTSAGGSASTSQSTSKPRNREITCSSGPPGTEDARVGRLEDPVESRNGMATRRGTLCWRASARERGRGPRLP